MSLNGLMTFTFTNLGSRYRSAGIASFYLIKLADGLFIQMQYYYYHVYPQSAQPVQTVQMNPTDPECFDLDSILKNNLK